MARFSSTFIRDTVKHILIPSILGNKNIILNVIPDAVFYGSVQVNGKWDSFNISWLPTNNTNYGRLFYEVKINDASKDTTVCIKVWLLLK